MCPTFASKLMVDVAAGWTQGAGEVPASSEPSSLPAAPRRELWPFSGSWDGRSRSLPWTLGGVVDGQPGIQLTRRGVTSGDEATTV